MVDASMNDTDIKMLIDNGVMWDELLFYGSDHVDGLGMKYEGEVRVVGAGDDRSKGTDSYTASNVSISFGDITFHDQSAVITPKDSGWADFFPGVAGQVCGAKQKTWVHRLTPRTTKAAQPSHLTMNSFSTSVSI